MSVSVFAEEVTIFAEDADIATSMAKEAPIAPTYLHTLESAHILGIVPIPSNLAVGCMAHVATSTGVENSEETPPDPECGLMVLSYSTSTSQVESGEGVVSSGAVLSVVDYYPFGEERISTGNSSTDRHFIGERFDEETEMSYLNARYYEGSRGQFLSQDPTFLAIGDPARMQSSIGVTQDFVIRDPQLMNSGRTTGLNSMSGFGFGNSPAKKNWTSIQAEYLRDPQMQNSYSYARNNPINMKDPEGLWGVFANGSLSAEAGLLSGFAGTASVGRGYVGSGSITNPQIEGGSYTSYGGLVGGFILGTTIEGSKGTDVNSMVAGVNVGPSVGLMFTNATKMEQLGGITRNSWSMTLGLGSFQWSKSENGVWTFSAGIGTPGLSISSYPTNTKVAPDKKDNKK